MSANENSTRLSNSFTYCLPIYNLLCLALFTLIGSCQSNTNSDQRAPIPVFTLLDSTQTGVNFINQLDERKDFNIFFFDYFYNGAGLAVGDINNDGLPDILFTANTRRNRLFLNKGNLQFEDVTEKSGLQNTGRWSTGAVMGDINNDGYLDIYICNGGPYTNLDSLKNELYINKGDGTFIEQADAYGLAGAHRSTQASFFDYNGDGLQDLFVMNYSDLVFRVHDENKVTTDYPGSKYPLNSCVLYKNEGNNNFRDVSRETGIQKPSFGLGLITSDLNGDGLVDIYISNDYLVPNFMFINQGDGTFKDEIKQRLDHCAHFSMGADYADINNDGLMDITEVDMMPEDHVLSKTYMRPMNPDLFFEAIDRGVIPQYMYNCLHIQHGYGIYSDIAQMAGVGKTDWSWATLLADVDNDGLRDLFVTNGFRRNLKNNDYIQNEFPQISRWIKNEQYDSAFHFLKNYPGYPLVNYLYKNNGDLTFSHVSEEWGIDVESFSNGAVFADLDRDGDLDIIINNIDQPAFIYKNNTAESSENQWIQFELTDKSNKRIPFNALVKIICNNGQQFVDELKTVRGYQSSSEPIIHFGLGANPDIDYIEIQWPDNSITKLESLEFNKRHSFDYSKVERTNRSNKIEPNYLWRDFTTTLFDTIFVHKEDSYHDFDKEILLPYKQSTLGPMLGQGDVNGDGFNDLFIGGAKGQAGRLYFMDPNKGFYTAPCQPWTKQAYSEDVGVVFFDADGDGDLDIYVASGGGGEMQGSEHLLQDRLYLNDGTGCFEGPVQNALPIITGSGGRVIAGDFTGNGLDDLFIAGRTNPGRYPEPGQSTLLANRGGTFEDVTDVWNKGLKKIGMVTDATFHDFNGDGHLDLILCGEWMSITLFIQEAGSFVDRSAEWGLDQRKGWWYSLTLADLNQDGQKDIIAGNLGLNNKFKIKENNPLHIFASDFDHNGTLDIVLSSNYKGNLVPVRGRACSSDQMPFISEKFPTYEAFANATLEEVYGQEQLDSALHYYADEARSMVWMRKGNYFEATPLPKAAQIGPILSSVVFDANNDGLPDIVIGGDIADTEPETPAFNGSRGMLLISRGNGQFDPVWLKKSGFYFTSKNVRDLTIMQPGNMGGLLILASANNSYVQALHFNGIATSH